jgi:hypothetical protein
VRVPSFGPRMGLHSVRNHRCRCPAELALATGPPERRWHCAMAMSRDLRRALLYVTSSGSQPYELQIQAASIAFVIGTTKNATPSRFAGSARISSKLDGVGTASPSAIIPST